jgi:NitT/TauT family transport system substrate-binding protein
MKYSRRSSLGVIVGATVGLLRPGHAGAAGASAPPQQVKVGVSPSAGTAAPIYWGLKNGLFEKVGINPKISVHADSGTVVPELLNGQLDFATITLGPMISAIDTGVPIKMVSTAAALLANNDAFSAVVVPSDYTGTNLGGVTKWASGTPQRNPLDKQLIEALGGDYDKMTIVSIRRGSIGEVVANHSAGAARLFEPMLSQALATGKVKVLTHVSGKLIIPGVPNSPVVASQSYLSQNADLAKTFLNAFDECYAFAASHRAAIGDFVPQTGMTDTPLKDYQLPGYFSGIDASGLQRVLDLYNQGYTEHQLTVDQVVWSDAPNIFR